MKMHELKVWPVFFKALVAGTKRFEYRRDDRGFEIGDVLRLREWDPAVRGKTPENIQTPPGCYTGRALSARVLYIARDIPEGVGIPPGFAILSIEVPCPDCHGTRVGMGGYTTCRTCEPEGLYR